MASREAGYPPRAPGGKRMTAPARVLFFLPSLGAYRDRVQLLMEVSRGVERLVLLVGVADAGLDASGYNHFRLVEVGFRRGLRPLNMLRSRVLAARLIRSESINVVHDTFCTLLPLLFAKRRYRGVRFCASTFVDMAWRLRYVWGDTPLWRKLRSRGKLTMYVNRLLERMWVARADRVIVQAPGLVPRLLESNRIPESRVAVVTNNVDVNRWAPADRAREARSQSGPLRMLFLGGIGPTRGAPAMLETVKLLTDRGVPATLTVAGSWEMDAETGFRSSTRRLGIEDRVSVAGRLSPEGVLEAFRSHDVFLYQTINDGSPRIVLEAMASGMAIIASHHPGIDVLDPEGHAISFTDFGDAEHMAELAAGFCEHPERLQKKGRKAREIAVERFNSRAVAGQYVDFYGRILSA